MIKLSEISTLPPKNIKEDDAKDDLQDMAEKIGKLAEIMYAEKKHSLLVVLQGMDSSGKDGTTEKVFERCSPASVCAYSFKKPTPEEFAHDFLWRVHKQAPEKGKIKIFIRSHYEDILIQRVHKWIDEDQVSKRINAINAFEELLVSDNNTTILKFYMHLSHERQGEKLQERIDEPDKNWKHNPGDWEERKLWDKYIEVYEDAINRSKIAWIIAPVDQRWYRNYFIAKKVLQTLESLEMKLPRIPIDG
jgi:PPK2 family polyphosphate:nucleotide phosphotransferase